MQVYLPCHHQPQAGGGIELEAEEEQEEKSPSKQSLHPLKVDQPKINSKLSFIFKVGA